MKNQKIKVLLLLLCSITILLSSCTNGNIDDGGEKDNPTVAETEKEENTLEQPVSPPLDPKYAKVRFGATKDILLLDVEWHTYESYIELYKDEMENADEEMSEYYNTTSEMIKSGELYLSKAVNGKSTFSIASSNPYNRDSNWNEKDTSQIDPDGYFIFNIYPFTWNVYYIDVNNEYHFKYFFDDNDSAIYTEKEFYFIADDVFSYCDDLLAENKITQAMYDFFVIKSPLDYYVRVLGLFGEEDLSDNLPVDISFPPTPDLITDKKDFSILFVGNSFVYTGGVPKQVSAISSMYGINVIYDSIAPSGAKLSETMDKAIEKMQSNKYDYVIFQDYGGRPLSERTAFLSDIEILCKEARESGAIPVLYNPAWANIDAKPYKDYQTWLTASHERAAKVNGAILINAGEAWIYAYDKYPDISLYLKNDYHANSAGAYLTACMFASTLFDLHIKDVAEDNLYHGDDAIKLGQAAWEYASYYDEHKKSPTEVVTVSDGLNEKVIK